MQTEGWGLAVLAAQAEGLCSVGDQVARQEFTGAVVGARGLNPDPSHETKARRIGPACGRQAPGNSTAQVGGCGGCAIRPPALRTMPSYQTRVGRATIDVSPGIRDESGVAKVGT